MTLDTNLIIVIFLLVLAAVDLSVGVANDAINFLNSPLGSKAAKFKTALTVAAAGVMVGVLFSSGMMEVARSGIFNPQYFVMPELLIIFLAVMYTDVILLDIFNTFGLPTSTTVSIVFGLLGSSVGMSVIKVLSSGDNIMAVFQYLNTASIFVIVTAIVSSVFFSFFFGYLIQYITRLIFTFDFVEKFKKYGAIWSGFALTLLTLFLVLKGAKGATFIPKDVIKYIQENMWLISGYAIIAWTIIIQLLMWFTKINMLKVIVMIGTFGLALSFAANDLVNFIGAPLAGLGAYTYAITQSDPLTAPMNILGEPVKAELWIILLSGLIMVVTLFVSKKARNVAKTELSLGRQDEGMERFESNMAARFIVRTAIGFSNILQKIVPSGIRTWVANRFDTSKYKPITDDTDNPPSFDLLRAAVILVVSSGLISLGTSFKLPLSTTYVTFIVAMAAALPDKAWGRDSAVFRVSGMLTVISGWFFTALMAGLMAFLICIVLYYGDIYAVLGFGGLVVYAFIRTGKFRREKDKEEEEIAEKMNMFKKDDNSILETTFSQLNEFSEQIIQIISKSYTGLIKHSAKQVHKAVKLSESLDMDSQIFIKNIFKLYRESQVFTPANSYKHIKSLILVQDISDRLVILAKQNEKHVVNNHHKFTEAQSIEIEELKTIISNFLSLCSEILTNKSFTDIKKLDILYAESIIKLNEFSDNQLNRLKSTSGNYRRSIVFANILTDTEYVLISYKEIINSIQDLFIEYINKK